MPAGGVIGLILIQWRVRTLPASIKVEWASTLGEYWPRRLMMKSTFCFSPVRKNQPGSSAFCWLANF